MDKDKINKLFESLRLKTIEKLKKLYPNSDIKVSLGKEIRTPKEQQEFKKRGLTKTDVSLHMFNGARDYNIFIDGKLMVLGDNEEENKKVRSVYENSLWKASEEMGLHHLSDAKKKNGKKNFGYNDPYHIGLVQEGTGKAIQELFDEFPEVLFDEKVAKNIEEMKKSNLRYGKLIYQKAIDRYNLHKNKEKQFIKEFGSDYVKKIKEIYSDPIDTQEIKDYKAQQFYEQTKSEDPLIVGYINSYIEQEYSQEAIQNKKNKHAELTSHLNDLQNKLDNKGFVQGLIDGFGNDPFTTTPLKNNQALRLIKEINQTKKELEGLNYNPDDSFKSSISKIILDEKTNETDKSSFENGVEQTSQSGEATSKKGKKYSKKQYKSKQKEEKTFAYYENLKNLYSGETDDIKKPTYNKDDYKKNIPIADIALGLGQMVISNAQSKEEYKDDHTKIDPRYQAYINDIKKLSMSGLPPEVEAEAKQKLSASYHAMLTNIVKYSGGNRNLILGNLSQAEMLKQKGLSELSKQDLQIKMKAMSMYGDAMSKVNDFEINKALRKQAFENKEIYRKKIKAEEKADSGLSYLLTSIENAKANAPGTFKHMLQEAYLSDIYGISPNASEEEKAKYYKEKEKERMIRQQKKDSASKLSLFSPNQKNSLEQFGISNPNATDEMKIAKINQISNSTLFGGKDPNKEEPNTLNGEKIEFVDESIYPTDFKKEQSNKELDYWENLMNA